MLGDLGRYLHLPAGERLGREKTSTFQGCVCDWKRPGCFCSVLWVNCLCPESRGFLRAHWLVIAFLY